MADLAKGIGAPKRFITDHNAEGKAVFNDKLPTELPSSTVGVGDKFYLGYATTQYPADFANNTDLSTYESYLNQAPGLAIPGGTVLRFVDIRPGGVSPMHRTVSLDYGIVLDGEIELVLDSGETRTLQKGDCAIQRGTMHMWRNKSQTEWGRMVYVLQESKPLEIGGKKLGEDYGGEGMAGVPPSGAK